MWSSRNICIWEFVFFLPLLSHKWNDPDVTVMLLGIDLVVGSLRVVWSTAGVLTSAPLLSGNLCVVVGVVSFDASHYLKDFGLPSKLHLLSNSDVISQDLPTPSTLKKIKDIWLSNRSFLINQAELLGFWLKAEKLDRDLAKDKCKVSVRVSEMLMIGKSPSLTAKKPLD